MTTSTVLSLTPYQQQSLPHYCQGALSLLQSTQPLNIAQAQTAIQSLYALLGLPTPSIVWGESPISVDFHPELSTQSRTNSNIGTAAGWGGFLGDRLAAIWDQLEQSIEAQLSWPVQMALEEGLRQPLLELPYSAQLQEQLERNHPSQARLWRRAIKPELWLEALALEAFALEMLNCNCDRQAWNALDGVVQHCGWLLPYENVCFVSDRPQELRLNGQGQLHGEGEAALVFGDRFSDGFALYANSGVRLPEHYGRLHPRQWQSHWIGEEPNPLLQEVLLEGIGYGRLVQELSGTVVDQRSDDWSRDSLIRIEIAGLDEPLLLLKRSCAQTHVMDVLRVPPYLRSAQSAACWVHWNLQAVAV